MSTLDVPEPSATAPREALESPAPLKRDPAFWGITLTQFLGAFNDNLFKQVVFLLFVAVPVTRNGEQTTVDLQSLVAGVFSVPFILFSGFAGYLSDRHSKRHIIVLAKCAEIGIMLTGVLVFYAYSRYGLNMTAVIAFCVVLFAMGTHSAFFGPGKFGILPELLTRRDLPMANGIILMTTFLAIILGSGLAGVLMSAFRLNMWGVGLACTGIAVVGTVTSLWIRRVPVSRPDLPFEWSTLAIPTDIWRLLRADHSLRAAIVASSIFWAAAAMVQMSVNALGIRQLEAGETKTSFLVSLISIGIAAGSAIAGMASKNRFNARVLKLGAWGLVGGLILMALPGRSHSHLLGYWGSIPALIVLGGFTGLFAVPLQVYMQSRPPEGAKGRMIATQNLLNWIGIAMAAPVYAFVERCTVWLHLPGSTTFGFTALMMGTVAVFYRPKDQTLD